MGKGDRRTRRGKIWNGSHGNARPRGKKPAGQDDATAGKTKPVRKTARKKAS